MATGNKLTVEIGADVSDLKQGITEAVIALEKLRQQKSVNLKAGLDVSSLNTQISAAKQNLDGLQKQLSSTSGSMGGLQKSTANGSNALMQFSRIAQDAPYGIMGIGNNLTATAEAFSYLKNQTGSTGGALKALAGSLMGSGGILLGISLLTTGFTLLAQSGLSVGDVIDKITGDFDESKSAMQRLNEEAAKGAQGQISTMNAYVNAASNINLSMSDRLIAVQKLQSEYPGYFGNLTKEQILNGDVAAQVRDVTKALIAKAKATASVEKIVKLAEEEEQIQNKINTSIAGMAKFYHLSKEEAAEFGVVLNKQLKGQINLLGELDKGNANNLSKSEKQALAAIRYSNNLQDLGNQLQKNISQQNKYTDSINKSTAASLKLDTPTPKAIKAPKPTEPTGDTPQVSAVSSLIPVGLVIPPINTAPIAEAFTGVRETVSSELLATMELMYNFSNDLNALVNDSLTSTFENLGTSIGEALATGGNVFSAIGNTLLQGISSFLSEMGGMLIKYGTLAVIKGKLDLAIASGGPISIGAGLAAIAVGVALKAIGGAIGARAKGGVSGGGGGASTSTGSGANNTSTTSGGLGFSTQSGGQSVVFEIAGTSLIGVLNNTTERNLRIGGKS